MPTRNNVGGRTVAVRNIALLKAVQTVCASYMEDPRMLIKKFEDKYNLDTQRVEPRIYIK